MINTTGYGIIIEWTHNKIKYKIKFGKIFLLFLSVRLLYKTISSFLSSQTLQTGK